MIENIKIQVINRIQMQSGIKIAKMNTICAFNRNAHNIQSYLLN